MFHKIHTIYLNQIEKKSLFFRHAFILVLPVEAVFVRRIKLTILIYKLVFFKARVTRASKL